MLYMSLCEYFYSMFFVIMLIAFGIDKDTVQHSTPLKQIQRCNSLCRVLTSVPFETVGVHPKTLPKSIIIVFSFLLRLMIFFRFLFSGNVIIFTA